MDLPTLLALTGGLPPSAFNLQPDDEPSSEPLNVPDNITQTSAIHEAKKPRLSDEAKSTLNSFFQHSPYPEPSDISKLAVITSLTERQIRVWFTNKRSRTPQRAALAAGEEPATTQPPKHRLTRSSLESLDNLNDAKGAKGGDEPFSMHRFLADMLDENCPSQAAAAGTDHSDSELGYQSPSSKYRKTSRAGSARSGKSLAGSEASVRSATTAESAGSASSRLSRSSRRGRRRWKSVRISGVPRPDSSSAPADNSLSSEPHLPKSSGYSTNTAHVSAPDLLPTRPQTFWIDEEAPWTARSSKATQKPIYVCTFCGEFFAQKYEWKRHEESVHVPRVRWVCEHNDCRLNRLPEDRTFFRRDGFVQHLRVKHGHHMLRDRHTVDHWKIDPPSLPLDDPVLHCGFCGLRSGSWEGRVEHVAQHFKNKEDFFFDWWADRKDNRPQESVWMSYNSYSNLANVQVRCLNCSCTFSNLEIAKKSHPFCDYLSCSFFSFSSIAALDQCPLCDYDFIFSHIPHIEILHHLKTAHRLRGCDQRVFTTSKEFLKHLREDHAAKPNWDPFSLLKNFVRPTEFVPLGFSCC